MNKNYTFLLMLIYISLALLLVSVATQLKPNNLEYDIYLQVSNLYKENFWDCTLKDRAELLKSFGKNPLYDFYTLRALFSEAKITTVVSYIVRGYFPTRINTELLKGSNCYLKNAYSYHGTNVSLTRVGVSYDESEAILGVSTISGAGKLKEEFLYLKKVENKWKVAKVVPADLVSIQ